MVEGTGGNSVRVSIAAAWAAAKAGDLHRDVANVLVARTGKRVEADGAALGVFDEDAVGDEFGPEDGIAPDTTYEIRFHRLALAGDAPAGAFGVGGGPTSGSTA